MIASRMNFVPIARILLAHRDIDVHLKDKDGNTALKFATLYNANVIILMIEAFIARELEGCRNNQYCRHLHEQYGKNNCPICLEQMVVGGDPICIAGDCGPSDFCRALARTAAHFARHRCSFPRSAMLLIGHRMHSACLQKWNQATCPICRKPTRTIANVKGVRIYSKFRLDSNRIVAPPLTK